MKNIVGIIPARGGSVGVPLKNIKKLNGLPLIAYTIKSAIDTFRLELFSPQASLSILFLSSYSPPLCAGEVIIFFFFPV